MDAIDKKAVNTTHGTLPSPRGELCSARVAPPDWGR